MAPRKIPDEMQRVLDIERQTRRKAFEAAKVNIDQMLASIAGEGMFVTSLYQDRTGEVWHCTLRYGVNDRIPRVPPGHGTCMAHALWDALRHCQEARFPERDVPDEKPRESKADTGGVTLAKPYVIPPKGKKPPTDDLDEALGGAAEPDPYADLDI